MIVTEKTETNLYASCVRRKVIHTKKCYNNPYNKDSPKYKKLSEAAFANGGYSNNKDSENESNEDGVGFNVIEQRKTADPDSSYVASLFSKGINKIAQKVGEEAVEMVIEAKDNDGRLFLNESADLLFHYLILLQDKGYKMKNVIVLITCLFLLGNFNTNAQWGL